MSQIDKFNYFPILFWFILLFVLFYSFIFLSILPLIYSGLSVRKFFYVDLLLRIVSKSVLLVFLVLVDFYSDFFLYFFSFFRSLDVLKVFFFFSKYNFLFF